MNDLLRPYNPLGGAYETARRGGRQVTHVWTAELDGRRHAATLYGVRGVQVPAVTAPADALEDALAAADA